MFIVMHCGGLPFNGDTIKTQSLGGSESAAYYMARELAKAGHKVTIFTNSQEAGIFDGVKYEWAGVGNDQYPLGDRFQFYAESTPHDVLIIQRHPAAFTRQYASKINLLWLHDLALQRTKGAMLAQAWNIDGFLTVSQFHKEQVVKEWGLNPDVVFPIQNGVDLSLFKSEVERKPHQLVYSSRPERGLEHLVRPGGIMERLAEIAPDFRLVVCGYENTTEQMEAYYHYLWERCENLPNVTNVGALSKAQLAELMLESGALVYPTEFEEVSCITAMEAMAAGLPMLTSRHAALPETCMGAGAVLFDLKDGRADEDAFVSFLITALRTSGPSLSAKQRAAARRYDWSNAALMLLGHVDSIFRKASAQSKAHHFMRHSDIPAFCYVGGATAETGTPLMQAMHNEYERGYAFYRDNEFARHYAAYYQYEADRGVVYGPEDVTGTSRFQAVASFVGKLPSGSRVLDYGCAHGHYTVALASMFPELSFVGVDLSESNVKKAAAWAGDVKLENIKFFLDDATDTSLTCGMFDLIIAAEVIEHVAQPQRLVDNLAANLNEGGRMVLTTPYGPWEAQGYAEHKFWRAHLHHFERQDLHEAFGHHPGFGVICAPSGQSKFSTPLGSYITTFTKPEERSRDVNMVRKTAQTMPNQTLSVCMIAKDAEADIVRCLKTVVGYAQEIIVGVDSTSTDMTSVLLHQLREAYPLIGWEIFVLPPVSDTGFAEARNNTIRRASCDWILWLDADEQLFGGDQLGRLLRNNGFNGYAVKQQHMSVEPLGLLKTDLPVRLFRNHIGIQFFGYVHEHPEQKMNDGLGHVCLAEGVQIVHHGYSTEPVRRGRFSRNIGLLERDRKENPDRVLGKFLWIRDLAQMCQYDLEFNRASKSEFIARAKEGIGLWESMLSDNHTRLCVDALPFYSQLVQFSGMDGFEFGFTVAASKMNGGLHMDTAQKIEGFFHNKEAAFELQRRISEERIAGFDSRYF